MERIGLFGGTFNPIHEGHLRAAEEVRKRFSLDNIYFIPAAVPPHKVPDALAETTDRLAMIRLAILEYPYFSASNIEVGRPGPSFTIDTVRYFKSTLPDETILYFISGLDAFLEIDTWKSYRDLLQAVPFIVMARPHEKFTKSALGWKVLEHFLNDRVSDQYSFSTPEQCYLHPLNQPVYIVDIKLMDISSTQIRNRIKKGRSLRPLVPETVADYIKSKGLYA